MDRLTRAREKQEFRIVAITEIPQNLQTEKVVFVFVTMVTAVMIAVHKSMRAKESHEEVIVAITEIPQNLQTEKVVLVFVTMVTAVMIAQFIQRLNTRAMIKDSVNQTIKENMPG